MRTIGIRVKPDEVTFAVYDTAEQSIINVETVRIPAALQTPDALKYVRNNVLDIIREYGIDQAGLRVTENVARSVSVRRIEIEGVLQEAFASSTLRRYFAGQIATIAAKLRIDRPDFKRHVSGEIPFQMVENWDELGEHQREAVLTAVAAENA